MPLRTDVERDFHKPGRGRGNIDVEGKGPGGGPVLLRSENELGLDKADCRFFEGCSEDDSDGPGAELDAESRNPVPIRRENRITVLGGRCGSSGSGSRQGV